MVVEKRMPISLFMAALREAHARKDGYIMGAKGQNPKKWAVGSWWYTQYKNREKYTAKQEAKALFWRENAERVWDCNGLAEGIYEDWSGVNINTKARYNYSGWCSVKGKGTVPADKRAEGVAVFHGDTASSISHVMYLDEPVDPKNPRGDWYLIEARGVIHGVVRTRLSDRDPDFWGIMDQVFDYGDADYVPAEPELGEVILKNGMMNRSDVRQMQINLLELGYDLGRWGADGDFGDTTEIALREFQKAHDCEVDGEYGPETHAAMMDALAARNDPAPEFSTKVKIVGGQCFIRSAPDKVKGTILGVAKADTVWNYGGVTAENGWLLIEFEKQNAWVSGKYGKLQTE